MPSWILRATAFPRDEYRRCWEALEAALPTRKACKTMVGLLRLAHMHACGTDPALAQALEAELDAGRVPDLEAMEGRFEKPAEVEVPEVPVHIPPSSQYDCLIPAAGEPT